MLENILKILTIPGLWTATVKGFKDKRGTFYTPSRVSDWLNAHRAELTSEAFSSDQFNWVENNKGAIRGFHAEPWEKFIFVILGQVDVVYLDTRPGETFGALVKLRLKKGMAVFIPRGVANSYMALTHGAIYGYATSVEWQAGVAYPAVNLFDPDLVEGWGGQTPDMIVIEKDQNAPLLKDAFPVEYASYVLGRAS
jgi:dTDP-4-dehydrorhamnose 3,5-epimerase-like enzyme